MSKGKVYLAGPIEGCTYKGCTEWREQVKQELAEVGIEGRSPMRTKTYLAGETFVRGHYHEHPLSSKAGIVTRDRFDVMTSDVVLINFLGATKVSLGTCIEVGWADAYRKPIILVMDKGNLHDHGMVTQIAGYIVNTLEEGIEIAKAILL